ncbi:MAG: GNAT family N-acetyltransferase, partial [Nocardioides sp.]
GGLRPALSTERLRLVPANPAHLDLLAGLNCDPDVMRYLLGRAATRAEVETEWAERLGVRTDEGRGLGYWVGFVDDDFVGWWSASSFATDPTVAGVGYRLRRATWGAGLATEGGRAMVTHAFGVPEVARVVASTMAVNLASRAVLAKLGMTHVDSYVEEWEDPLPGSDQGEVVYALTRRDWLER